MPKDGKEVYITPLETAILREIGRNNPKVTEKETIKILSNLILKLE